MAEDTQPMQTKPHVGSDIDKTSHVTPDDNPENQNPESIEAPGVGKQNNGDASIEAPHHAGDTAFAHSGGDVSSSKKKKKSCRWLMILLVVAVILAAVVVAVLFGRSSTGSSSEGPEDSTPPVDEDPPTSGTNMFPDEIQVVSGRPLEDGQDLVSLTVVEKPALSNTALYVTLGPDEEPPYSELKLYFPTLPSTLSTSANAKSLTLTTHIQLAPDTLAPWNVDIMPFDGGEENTTAWEFLGDYSEANWSEWAEITITKVLDPFSRYISSTGDLLIRIYSDSLKPCYFDAIWLLAESSDDLGDDPAPPTEPPTVVPKATQRWSAFAQFLPDWESWKTLVGNGVCDPMEWCRTDSACCPDVPAVCGNGLCEETENGGSGNSSCAADCSHDLFVCGNGICEATGGDYHKDRYEDEYMCPQDCNPTDPNLDVMDPEVSSCFMDETGCPALCGDGLCDSGETCIDCPRDCGACEVAAGDGICSYPFEESTSPDCDGSSIANSITLEINGATYAVIDDIPFNEDVYTDTDCSTTFKPIPTGWRQAAWDPDVAYDLVNVGGATFATFCLVFSDGNAVSTDSGLQGTSDDGCGTIPLIKDMNGQVAITADSCPSRVLIQRILGDSTDLTCETPCMNGGICNPLTGTCACPGRYIGPVCEREIGDYAVLPGATTWYKPEKGVTWEWQIDGLPIPGLDDGSLALNNIELYDIDYDYPASTVSALKDAGKKVMCYISAGSYEDFRNDKYMFHNASKGEIVSFGEGDVFVDENWLDLRRLDLIAPIMLDRLDVMKAKGCDAVEWDNADLPIHDVGFSDDGRISLSLQMVYNRWLVAQTHARGMGVAMKNNNEAAAFLADDYDMVVNEECFINGNCPNYWPFLNLNKPVLNTEYFTARCMYCDHANKLGFSTIKKIPDLDSCRVDCKTPYPVDQCVAAGYTGSYGTDGNLAEPIDWTTMDLDWCPMTTNTDPDECPFPRFGPCDPFSGY